MRNPTPTDPINRSQLRVIQYQNVDGSYDLTFGGLFLLMAVCFQVFAVFPGFGSTFSFLLIMGVFVGGGYLFDRLARLLKERITFRRTGYIVYKTEPRPLKRSTRLVIYIGVPLLIVTMWILLFLNRAKLPAQNQDYALSLMPGFTGILFAGLYAIIGWKIAWRRYFLIAGVALAVGLGLIPGNLPVYTGMTVLFGMMGLTLLMAGGITLWSYLRLNPESEEAK
jgi:hypothetical protein